MNKKLVASIFLYEKEAVTHFTDLKVIAKDPVELAVMFHEQHADELVVFDLSMGEKEHEDALAIIQEICSAVAIPVIGAGNIRRLEDVKKLLYAGCHKAALNFSKESNISLAGEASARFGKEKIAVCSDDVNTLILLEDIIETSASEVIYLGKDKVKMAAEASAVPVITWLPEVSLEKLIETLKREGISGVMGTMVNENAVQFDSLKMLLKNNGIPMTALEAGLSWEEFKKNSDGHVPVIVQDYRSDAVLMMAYMDKQAYEKTLSTGLMTYYSRSRQRLWVKGESSGHYQYVKKLTADCDKDTILAKVSQVGPACHTGQTSCFFNTILEKEDADAANPLTVFRDVYEVILDRKLNPKEGSYTNYLFDKGVDKILKKLGEEAAEIIIASKNPNSGEIKYEICDFLYHLMVLMAEKQITWEEITDELSKR